MKKIMVFLLVVTFLISGKVWGQNTSALKGIDEIKIVVHVDKKDDCEESGITEKWLENYVITFLKEKVPDIKIGNFSTTCPTFCISLGGIIPKYKSGGKTSDFIYYLEADCRDWAFVLPITQEQESKMVRGLLWEGGKVLVYLPEKNMAYQNVKDDVEKLLLDFVAEYHKANQ
jgi:hypothetical protein